MEEVFAIMVINDSDNKEIGHVIPKKYYVTTTY